MRPHSLPSVAALLAIAVLAAVALPAQGVVNPTLLRVAADEATSPLRTAGPAGVVARARGSVVWVAVEVDGPKGAFVIERASSGVLVDGGGLVLTLAGLVRESVGAKDKRLWVQLDDAANTKLSATVRRIDDATGLALLSVTPPSPLPSAELGAQPMLGEPVVVVARPAGKEMLAFAGVASSCLAPVALGGRELPAASLFLCDSRNDERCDGAPVFDAGGRVLGIYASEHVQRDVPEPTLADLQRPSFGVVVSAAIVRGAFAKEFQQLAAGNISLRTEPAPSTHPHAEAVAAAAPAVVSVWSGEGDWPALGGKDPGAVVRRRGLGSGVIVSGKGLVVCNAHVCAGGTPRVRLLDGRTFPAAVLQKNSTQNLALLQLALPAGTALPVAACGVDDDNILGEWVLAVGNPIGNRVVVSGGVVSARRGRDGARLQADANLGNQNGGGAILDASGRLLGIGDAGAEDPIELAYRMRGDRMTTESNLSTFVGISRVRKLFAEHWSGADAAESIRSPLPPSDAARARRTTPLTAMVERTAKALLNVYIAHNTAVQREDDPFPPEPKWRVLGLGSGVIVDPSGLAISNWHVVDDATNPDGSMVSDHKVTVRTFDGAEYPVKVLSISREDDLALLQLELEPGQRVQAVEFGSSEHLAIGEPVAAIGNPHGQANTITFGVCTAKGQELKIKGRWADMKNLIETDAAINGGNSGGALLDMAGRLVGINSAGGGTFNNKGYAIEVDHVRRQLLTLLFAAYKLRSPDLGMRVLDDGDRVVVMDTDPRGPAHAAGVMSGDRVLAIDDVAITWSPGLAMTLLQKPAGVPLSLRLERKGKEQVVQMAPVPAEVWSVVRQSGILTRDFEFAEDEQRARAAAIALHRAFTGDTNGEPAVIPERFVAIERVFPGEQSAELDLQPGDLLLAVDLVLGETADATLVRLDSVAALRDLWNRRDLGTYEGKDWNCWVARGGSAKRITIRSKRLFW